MFGRGCYGGGGFNCDAALQKIRERDFSCAIFAPGWTYELPHREGRVKQDFFWREHAFWSRLEKYLNFHALKINMETTLEPDPADLELIRSVLRRRRVADVKLSCRGKDSGGFGELCAALVFRSCFSVGRGEGWFHLSSMEPQPSLVNINLIPNQANTILHPLHRRRTRG